MGEIQMDLNSARRTLSTQLTALLGTTSLFAVSGTMPALAAEMVAQADEIPETVLITGSLIRGTAAVGVPVTNLSPQDFAQTGALNTADLFRSFPAANVMPAGVATNSGATIERAVKVNIRGLDTGTATRSLLMVDGIRFPAQGNGQCIIDPSIIPALSQDHIDVLVDGASATYGSDAISGVINIVLKRNMDGAITQLRWTAADGGKNRYLASAVWGRTWDGGQVTVSYEWYNDSHVAGNFHSQFGIDFRPWGFDDKRPLGSSLPGTISTGAAAQPGGGPIGTGANTGSGCTNCYAVPLGAGQTWSPGASGVGPPARPIGQPNANPYALNLLDWTTFGVAANGGPSAGSTGVRNQFDPYHLGWYDANQERNGGHITIDQRLTSNISFYGSAFYSNRRAFFVNASNIAPSPNNALAGFAVPTFNPYYPVNAPTNLRAYYNIGWESPPTTSAYELAQRYQLGLNIALPYNWSGRIWYAETKDSNYNHTDGSINKAAVSAALGWTIGVTPASGTTPAIASWAKPANIPYLNLFCDPLAYQCNSPTTLAYVQGVRTFDQDMKLNEKGVNFDGPLFDLPGGTVKMAVGGNYTTYQFSFIQLSNTNASNLILPYALDPEKRAVWATWAQINIPVFTDQNSLPFLRRLELEFSWRHDQYSDVGGTSNPKVSFNWSPIEDFTVRGTWGNSFRAPVFGEISPLANVAITGRNMSAIGLATDNQPIGGCGSGAMSPDGSGAWKVLSSYGNGTIGSTTACPAAGASVTLPNGFVLPDARNPYGITYLGGSAGAEAIRVGGLKGWSGLTPELVTNWGIGIDYTPTNNFLTGLNIQATYYIIKINALLTAFGNPNSGSFNDPNIGDFAFIVPTDYQGIDPGCTNNMLPTTCAPFQDAVQSLIAHPRAQIDAAAKTLIMWINDGGSFNKGWLKMEGIDWNWSYDWDWGDIGAFNIGMAGTYYLHRRVQPVYGADINDEFHQTINLGLPNEAHGIATLPRMRYRARVGWASGSWSATLFLDHTHHYYHTQSAPPNVNGSFCASNGGLDANGGGGTFPCAIQDYTNLVPSYYTFDLSLGYNTLDLPANEYLRNIGFQLVVQNIFDRRANFLYKGAAVAGGPCTCDPLFSNIGRQISVIVTKQW
jgi:outer membrane receptor protein involved in Fe transport